MEEVNKVTVALKNHHQSLHMGDAMINELQDVSEKYKNKLSRDHATSKVNVWFRSHFTVHKALTSYAALCPDHCSQNGVCRIQQEQWLTLTNAETEACEPLLKGNIGSIDSEIYQDATPASPDLDTRLKLRLQMLWPSKMESPAVNCVTDPVAAAKPNVDRSVLLYGTRAFWQITDLVKSHCDA